MTQGIQISKENNKVNIVLDMSMLDLFLLCPARYNYRHNMNKAEPIHLKSTALDMGGLLHEGMEVYFTTLKEGLHYNDRMHKAIRKIQEFSSDPDKCNATEEEVAEIITAIEQSCEYWRWEDETLEVLEVERAFAYVLFEDDSVRIVITGKIDLLVNKPGIGPNAASYNGLVMDHKSYRREFPVQRLSNQFQNYCVAAESNYLVVNRIGLQKSKSPDEKFKRLPLSYDTLILEEWKQNVIDIILTQYLTCLGEEKWFMNVTSCLKFNRLCEYYSVCDSSGKEAKLYKLSQFDTISPWDVTAKFTKN